MREIKFRGKDIATNKWVYGYLYRLKGVYTICENIRYGEETPIFIDTLGQYTGLHDKNGVEIYEGDIVKIPSDYEKYGINAGEVYEVYFACGGFRLKPKYGFNTRGYWLEDDNEIEVIGNIYDNPDLLKGE